MNHYRLAFLGFGNVGKELARLLLKKAAEVQQRYGISYSVVGIATGRHGIAIDKDGINLENALQAVDLSVLSKIHAISSISEYIQKIDADVLFESIPVNYQSGQPAIEFLQAGLQHGMHAITANKGPVVHAYERLTRLAKEKGRKFYFESAVMDGAPVFGLYRETLPAATLISLKGVLNSTTNLILTLMERGSSFEDAVKHCQQIGIAETDPSGDIDGWDAAVKVSALVTVMMGFPLTPDQVDRTGIRELASEDIAKALEAGKRWKLVCSARRDGSTVSARVAPELVGPDSPMYNVDGTTSIVQFETDVLGLLSLFEENPGPHTTAYGMFADFLNAVGVS